MTPMLQKISCSICFVAIYLTSCAARSVHPPSEVSTRSTPAESNVGKLSYLDLNNPSIVQAITPEDAAEGRRFVRVEVKEVLNPKKYPITFRVHYQSKTNEKAYLGSFGLFPAENPGSFIVATRGMLRNEGAIILTLVVGSKVDAGDTVKVGVKKIRFVNG